MMIGAFPFAHYTDTTVTLAAGSKLFVYSDGFYEVTNPAESMMTIAEFGDILADAGQHPDQLDTIVNAYGNGSSVPISKTIFRS